MTQANTDELENATPADEPTTPATEEQDSQTVEEMAAAMEAVAAEAGASADAPAESSDPSEISVTHIGPEFVDPAPPKEIRLPDTPEIRRILRLQVPMIVRLADKIMPLGEILQWAPGAIIEFNKAVGEDLELMINNKSVGAGQAVKVGEKFGLKVTNVTTLEQMIRAMAGR